jgi:hypothetical protein
MAGYCPQGRDRMLTCKSIAPNARRAVVPGLESWLAGGSKRAHACTAAHPGNDSAAFRPWPPKTFIQLFALRTIWVVPEPRPTNVPFPYRNALAI